MEGKKWRNGKRTTDRRWWVKEGEVEETWRKSWFPKEWRGERQ